jgi:hypothetical protein
MAGKENSAGAKESAKNRKRKTGTSIPIAVFIGTPSNKALVTFVLVALSIETQAQNGCSQLPPG